MKYQPLNDVIDPDVVPEDAVIPEPEEHDPDAPNDAYVIGERGNTVQAPDLNRIEEDQRTGPRAWVKPAALLLVAVCIGLTVWNLTHLISGPPAPPKPTPFQVKQALYLGAMRIEAYRRVHGVTPDALEDVGLPNPPYSYTRVDSTRYTVGIDSDGPRLEYESSIPLGQFFGTPQEMLTIGGSK
jgi:hypothetical protein